MTRRLPIFIILAIGLIGTIVTSDITELYQSFRLPLIPDIREFLNLMILGLFYLHLHYAFRHRLVSVQDTLNKLIQLLLMLLILYSFVFILNGFAHIEFVGLARNNLDRLNWNIILGTAIISYGAAYMLMKMIFYLRVLIYYKRRKYTSLIFQLFAITLMLTVILVNLYGETVEFNPEIILRGDYLLITVSNGLLVVFAILLALRNSWVTYLTRRNKFVYVTLAVLLLLYIEFVLGDIILGDDDFQNIKSHSLIVHSFIDALYHSIYFYTATTLGYLVLHLPTARVFDRKMREVQSLYKLSQTINSEPDFNKLVLMITNMASDVTEAHSTWLEINDEESGKLYIASSKSLTSHEIKNVLLSKTDGMSGSIFQNKSSILINELAKSADYRYLQDWKPDIASLIAVPLLSTKGRILGILFVTKNYEFGFDPDDVSMLEAYANQVVIALENSKLINESIQRERLEQELKIAREVQMKLLPQEIPQSDQLDMDAIAFTANEVGGDYFDFYEDTEQIAVVVADVSGKGTSAAFYMAELKGIIKSLSTVTVSPSELMKRSNQILYEQLEKKSFVTASLLSVHRSCEHVSYVRAGHCPLIHYRAADDSLEFYVPGGMGLGLCGKELFDPMLEEITIPTAPGDIFALYTDGINEARNENGEEYGDDHIGELLRTHASRSAKEIKNAILDDIIEYSGRARVHDDMTLAIVKFIN